MNHFSANWLRSVWILHYNLSQWAEKRFVGVSAPAWCPVTSLCGSVTSRTLVWRGLISAVKKKKKRVQFVHFTIAWQRDFANWNFHTFPDSCLLASTRLYMTIFHANYFTYFWPTQRPLWRFQASLSGWNFPTWEWWEPPIRDPSLETTGQFLTG